MTTDHRPPADSPGAPAGSGARGVAGPAHLQTVRHGTSGPAIVFLHGLFGQGRNWTTIAKALSGRARVLLPDLPDHGRSPWSESISYPAMAASVAASIDEAFPGESITLVGHSMGGKVAMMLALQHPALVERLCVVDISPVRYHELRSFADYVRGMRALDLAQLPDRTTADAGLREAVPDPVVRGFLLQNLRRGARDDRPGASVAAGGTEPPAWHWQMNLQLLGDHLAELGSWTTEGVEPYRGPVLWLAGSESRYVRPEFAPAMRALFPRVQLVTVKGAGHWVHADHPAVFEQAVRRFTGLV